MQTSGDGPERDAADAGQWLRRSSPRLRRSSRSGASAEGRVDHLDGEEGHPEVAEPGEYAVQAVVRDLARAERHVVLTGDALDVVGSRVEQAVGESAQRPGHGDLVPDLGHGSVAGAPVAVAVRGEVPG